MTDETKKPLDAGEISEDDLQQVAGGATLTSNTEIKIIDKLPATQPAKIIVSYDIAENKPS